MNEKKLMRSNTHKAVAGVLGGVGEYLDIDPNAIRVIYVLLTVFTGFFPGLIAYIFAVLILPTAPVITPSRPAEEVHDTEAI